MRLRRRSRLEPDRLTLALAGVALATVGTVVGGELWRLAKRRLREADESEPGTALDPVARQRALAATGRDAVVVAREGLQATPRHELVLFNMLTGFVGAFAVVRIGTHGIRAGWWPGNVRLGGKHIHHFVPGILLAFGAGGAALMTSNEALERTLAIPFGVGLGLVLDEAALLLDLRDVYWTREGILSVQLSLGAAAIMGGTIIALRILHRGERQAEAHAEIPAA
ncbi:MAG TPA: hypothetical protein VIL04_14000 [Solirubrobacterales bacterium]|jgi:hypothetical protein